MAATLTWNTEWLVQMSVVGEVASPISHARLGGTFFHVDRDGHARFLPPWGGVTRNVRLGDPARGWEAERVEPGVSLTNRDAGARHAMQFLSCIGNEATVISGGAQGARGVVTGKQGRFAETVMVQFPSEVLPKLAAGDRVNIVAWGTGLRLDEAPGVHFQSLDPALAPKVIKGVTDRVLEVPVKAIVPPHLAGAGLGLTAPAGSLAIQTVDEEELRAHGLADLRLGDVIAFQDIEARYEHVYRRRATSVAVVSAGDSAQAGFGIPCTIVITSLDGRIRPFVDGKASIAPLLG
jgi:hypothetical protein